jgi:cobalamin biosynthesis Mg chelatase CobN
MSASETPTMMMDRLADAAWDMLADQSPRAIHIDDVANSADIAPAAARAVAGSITALILHKLQRLDRQAVLESLADLEDAGDVPIRDKIVEAMMHRFEIYAPYRRQVAQLDMAARRDPALGLRLLDSLAQAMRMLLRMVGDDLAGLQGEARVRGVAGVAMVVARTWKDDDTPDLSATLKEIDRRLATAEEWGRTLRVLAGEPSPAQEGDDPVSAGDDGRDQTPGGRYQ